MQLSERIDAYAIAVRIVAEVDATTVSSRLHQSRLDEMAEHAYHNRFNQYQAMVIAQQTAMTFAAETLIGVLCREHTPEFRMHVRHYMAKLRTLYITLLELPV